LASKNISQLNKALTGDKRTFKKRRYGYWRLGIAYWELIGRIKGFRNAEKGKTFDRSHFDFYCKYRELPEPYPNLILNSKQAPGQLALDILVAKGLIDDAKAFQDFLPVVNKIQEKHFGGTILGLSGEALPVIADFLDLPSTHPEIVFALNPLNVLERVPIDFSRPNS
jgi:hypothetical protein